MLPPTVRHSFLILACAVTCGAVVAPLAERSLKRWFDDSRTRTLRALLEEEEEELRERGGDGPSRFDRPDEAVAFYVNSRTGPIITRGPNITRGVRPLDSSAYLPALRQMRAMPRYSVAEGRVLPSYGQMPNLPAAGPGSALTVWTSLGPSNQGGRTRSLLIDPGNANVMYAGGVAGGVWKSTDAGANWTPLGQLQMANLAVASLAFDPTTTSTIYAGTGEGPFSFDAVRGAGIFRSTDAGATWTQLASTNTSNFYYVTGLVVSPRNSQRLWASTRTGLFRSTDGGASWTQMVNGGTGLPIDGNAVNGCTQVTTQVTGATGFVFASCGNSAQGTVYRAADTDSSTFSSVLSNSGMSRSSIAIAPSNPAVVYVMSASTTSGGPGVEGLHAVYRSTANGDPGTFTTQVDAKAAATTDQQKINQLLLTNTLFALSVECGFGATNQIINQGYYDNVLAVDPLDANRVWAGGIDTFRSDDGGVNWGTASFGHHPDQHALVFHPGYNGSSNKILFSASDGGLERLDDARTPVNTTVPQVCGMNVSSAWTTRNNGYVTTQFYDGTVYPDGAAFFGGLQDNGTRRGTTASTTWSLLRGGDGGYVAVDTLGDANAANDVLFVENVGLSLNRSTDGGASFSPATTGITNAGFLFITPFAMNQGNKQQLWIGGQFLFRTTNQGSSWVQASADTPGSGSVSAIAVHPLDGNRVLAGMSDGKILSSTTALGTTSATSWSFTSPTNSYISWLAWDPNNPNVAYATVSSFGVTNLLKSFDAGASWAPSVGIGATALPAIPALSVVVNPSDSQQVFVGTDLGVFTSVDGGASWYLENTGFANTPVEALKFNETPPYQLYAFTHGRGAWRVALNTLPPTGPVATADTYSTPVNSALMVAAPGVLGNDSANGGGSMTAVLDTTTANGSLLLNTNGGFTFTPTAGFTGTTWFAYHPTNGNGPGNVVTVSITVQAGAPTTVADSYSVSRNGVLNVSAPGVLGNDSANGGGAMSAALVTGVTHGTLTLNASGSFSYLPAGGYSGPDSFSYRATTAVGNGNVVSVSLTVNPGPPTTIAEAYNTPVNTVLNVAAPGVLANDAANGGASLTASLQSSVAHGTLTLNTNGAFTYAPTSGYAGLDGFTYRAVTSVGPGNTVTVPITVGVSTPTSLPDSYATAFNTALTVGAPGVLVNDNTNGGGTMTAAVVTTVTHGTLVLTVNGGFTYSPALGYFGSDTFTYRATNSTGPGNTVTVSLTVDPPVGGGAQPPSAFRITAVNGNTVSMSWTLPTAGPAVLGLQLEGGVAPGSVLGALRLGVTPGATINLPTGSFYLRMRTITLSGLSGPSNEIVAHVNVPVMPSAPSNLLGLVNGGLVALAWTPTFGGGAPSAAILDVTGQVSASLPLGNVETFAYPSVPPGTYTFSVRQTNAGGASGGSNAVTLSFPGACSGAPQIPRDFAAFNAGGVLTVTWDAPANGAAPTAYTLNVGGSFVGALPVAGRSLVVPAVPPGTYTFSVKGTNPCGTSAATATQSVTFP